MVTPPHRRCRCRRLARLVSCFVVSAAVTALAPIAHAAPPPAAWSTPHEPFHVAGNIYYVGTAGLASWLIVTPAGDILLDGTLPGNVPQIEANIVKLGFRLGDVKILLNTHAHYDHAGGLAQLKRDTGAMMLASPGDRWALENGMPRGENVFGRDAFPPVKVDRTIRDGERIRLGSATMTAWLTPGHTPGCTTWAIPVRDGGRTLRVVFPGSISVAGNVLLGNKAYPEIADDYRHSFEKLAAMKADIVLTAHPEYADVMARHDRQAAGQMNAFVAPDQLRQIVASARQEFDAELAKERRAIGSKQKS